MLPLLLPLPLLHTFLRPSPSAAFLALAMPLPSSVSSSSRPSPSSSTRLWRGSPPSRLHAPAAVKAQVWFW
jgi:hypothetical protein